MEATTVQRLRRKWRCNLYNIAMTDTSFFRYFLTQNEAISKRQIAGIPLNLQVLGIGDGLTVLPIYFESMINLLTCSYQNPLIQYPGYITYAGHNPYHPLVTQDVIDAANVSWTTPVTGCRDLVSLPSIQKVLFLNYLKPFKFRLSHVMV